MPKLLPSNSTPFVSYPITWLLSRDELHYGRLIDSDSLATHSNVYRTCVVYHMSTRCRFTAIITGYQRLMIRVYAGHTYNYYQVKNHIL